MTFNHEFQAETFEEMGEMIKKHGMEMAEKGDKPHLEVMAKMKKGMNDPKATQEWMDQKRKEFDVLPENN